MLIGHTAFLSLLWPTFWQWHWSPHHMDIYNSQIHGSWFGKQVISHCIIMSKSPVLRHGFSICLHQNALFYFFSLDCSTIFNLCKVSICLWSCFVEISSHLRDCNGHDDWHPYMLYTHALLSPATCALCTSGLMNTCFIMIIPVYMLIIFVNLYDHAPHVPYYKYYFCFVW